VQEAFAADDSDVERELEREKDEQVEDQADVRGKDPKARLPGWGTWVGEGVVESDRARARREAREKLAEMERAGKIAAVRQIRRDANLKHVIVSEKLDRQAAKYKARNPPNGVTKQHYERLLAMPVGKEWQTTATHHRLTMPAITTQTGVVIKPITARKLKHTPTTTATPLTTTKKKKN
jgi:U3 small nucleolar RNA-associated protein 14